MKNKGPPLNVSGGPLQFNFHLPSYIAFLGYGFFGGAQNTFTAFCTASAVC
jgi:hypothetical protein